MSLVKEMVYCRDLHDFAIYTQNVSNDWFFSLFWKLSKSFIWSFISNEMLLCRILWCSLSCLRSFFIPNFLRMSAKHIWSRSANTSHQIQPVCPSQQILPKSKSQLVIPPPPYPADWPGLASVYLQDTYRSIRHFIRHCFCRFYCF